MTANPAGVGLRLSLQLGICQVLLSLILRVSLLRLSDDEPTTVPQPLQVGGLDTDVHIIINEGGGVGVGAHDGGVEVGVDVVDGIEVPLSRTTTSQWGPLLVLLVLWENRLL